MSDFPGADEAAAEIHAEFAQAIRYTGAGVANKALDAVKANSPAAVFQGAGSTARQTSFEIPYADLPERPGKRDLIVENDGAGRRWSVIDVTDRDDVNAWVVLVEKAG